MILLLLMVFDSRCHCARHNIRFLADRQRGIGCDQVLLVEPPDHPDADFRYRIFKRRRI